MTSVRSVWPTVPVGSILVDIQPGFACGRHNINGNGVPHLRPMNVTVEGQIDRTLVKYVDPGAVKQDIRLHPDDVLFNNTNSPELVGKTALFLDDDCPAFSNHMTRLRVDQNRALAGYVALRLHNAWRAGWFEAHCNNHVSQASIGRDVLSALEIQLPPLKIQRQIVDRANIALNSRWSSIKHVRTADKYLDRFRVAVLAAACNGRLTQEWRVKNPDINRANSTPADEKADVPNSWSLVQLGDLVRVATGATPLRSRKDYYGGSIPWVTSSAVNAGTITHAAEHITQSAIRETNAKVFPAGTLLVAMYGEGQTRGRVAQLGIAAATNQAVAALLFDERSASIRPYLRIFLEQNYDSIRLESFGGVQPNLSLGLIRARRVPLPPADEQREIVLRVESVLAKVDDLRRRIHEVSRRVGTASSRAVANILGAKAVS